MDELLRAWQIHFGLIMLAVMLLKKKVVAAGYRYVRLNNLSATGSNQYLSINELQIIDSSSGTNWCSKPGVVASAATTFSGLPPSNLIDNQFDDNHRWASIADPNANVLLGTAEWVKIDLGQVRSFDSIKIAATSAANQRVTACIIQASADDVTYTNLKTITSIPYPDGLSTTLVEILK